MATGGENCKIQHLSTFLSSELTNKQQQKIETKEYFLHYPFYVSRATYMYAYNINTPTPTVTHMLANWSHHEPTHFNFENKQIITSSQRSCTKQNACMYTNTPTPTQILANWLWTFNPSTHPTLVFFLCKFSKKVLKIKDVIHNKKIYTSTSFLAISPEFLYGRIRRSVWWVLLCRSPRGAHVDLLAETSRESPTQMTGIAARAPASSKHRFANYVMKNFNTRDSHDLHGSKLCQLARHAHSRGSHPFAHTLYIINTVTTTLCEVPAQLLHWEVLQLLQNLESNVYFEGIWGKGSKLEYPEKKHPWSGTYMI